ncbi:tetratricopeptide repeat protein [bacterium]|nr:MAG: tetratricopeptide repeat protein [bacterium]
MSPSAFHRTNAILHTVNVLLLFGFLRAATGSTWKSFFAAAFFGLHPLRAESVAWITERKDVLCGFFLLLLSLIAYLQYAKTPGKSWLAASVLLFAAANASKPAVVLLPAALLALDFWPLERSGATGTRKLLLEKAPFAVVSIVFSLVTVMGQRGAFVAQKSGLGALAGGIATASSSYWIYLHKTFWPVDLVMEAGREVDSRALALGAASLVALCVLSWALWRFKERSGEFFAGWCWYLPMLLPVSGVASIGLMSVADRFTYFPHIFLLPALVFGLWSLYGGLGWRAAPAVAFAAALLAVLTALSYRQVSRWKDSITLFGYMEKVSGRENVLALHSLGVAYENAGLPEEAYRRLAAVNAMAPDYPWNSFSLGLAALKTGRHAEAARAFEYAALRNPDYPQAQISLEEALRKSGRLAEAAQRAVWNIRRWPGEFGAMAAIAGYGGEFGASMTAAEGFFRQGKYAPAIQHFRDATALDPSSARAWEGLARSCEAGGQSAQALRAREMLQRLSGG